MVTVKLNDGTAHEIEKFVLYDFIGLEKQFGVPVKEVSESGKVTYLAFLAWHALHKRAKVFAGDFDAFCQVLEGVETDDEDDEEGAAAGDPPTEPDQPTG